MFNKMHVYYISLLQLELSDFCSQSCQKTLKVYAIIIAFVYFGFLKRIESSCSIIKEKIAVS